MQACKGWASKEDSIKKKKKLRSKEVRLQSQKPVAKCFSNGRNLSYLMMKRKGANGED